LVVAGWSAGIDENARAHHCSQDLWFVVALFVDVHDDEKVEIHSLIIVGSGAELHGTEINLPINHFHFPIPPDSHINQRHMIAPVTITIFLHCKHLRLALGKKLQKGF
jgi:hypothetical protein